MAFTRLSHPASSADPVLSEEMASRHFLTVSRLDSVDARGFTAPDPPPLLTSPNRPYFLESVTDTAG